MELVLNFKSTYASPINLYTYDLKNHMLENKRLVRQSLFYVPIFNQFISISIFPIFDWKKGVHFIAVLKSHLRLDMNMDKAKPIHIIGQLFANN
jgi:hypothetical protein